MKIFRTILFGFLASLLSGAGILLPAQFQLQSISPANGTAAVDTVATIVLTFNQPLDTSVQFSYPEDFFLNSIILPDSLVGEADSLSLSPDLKTVYIHNLHLRPDTQYWLMIVNAVSLNGDSLDRPYCATFSTGSTIASGVVDGRVLNSSSTPDITGTVMFLFGHYPFSDRMGIVIPATVITDPIGNFSISYVPAGTYWVVALKNFCLSDFGEFELKPNAALGFPDYDYDLVIDSIFTVAGGYLNMNPFFLDDATSQTVQTGAQNVEPIAQNWQADASLTTAMGASDSGGKSTFWFYTYYSPAVMQHNQWVAVGPKVWWANVGFEPDDIYPLPPGWMDSDSALVIAEANGGWTFRQMYPNARIYASVGGLARIRRQAAAPLSLLVSPGPPKQSSVQQALQSTAVWWIEYYVPNDTANFSVVLDALTGENLTAPCTAYPSYQFANLLAGQWANDARLYQILSLAGMDTLGKCGFWQMDFYSPTQQMLHSYYMVGRLPVSGWVVFQPPDTLTVPSGWMDSDQALWIAESAGGAAFRQQHPGSIITTELSRWHNSPNPEKTVWVFYYQAPAGPTETYIVDAFSGQVVSLRHLGNSKIPKNFELSPPYPNPFNPETRIIFAIPTAGKVDLQVYNVLGQRVEHPVSLDFPAGKHEVVWKPSYNLPAGIYWLHLRWKNQQKVCKAVLVK